VNARSHMALKKQLSIAILVAVFLLWIMASCSYGGNANNPTSVGSSTAVATPTSLPLPIFHVAMLDVIMRDYYYGDTDTNLASPPVWTVAANADVILNLENKGTFKHNWAIVKKGATIPVPYKEGQAGDILLYGVGMVYTNSKTTVTFTAPEPGEYVVICTVSGHYPTMQGRLVVK